MRVPILSRSSVLVGLLLVAAAFFATPVRAEDRAGIDALYRQMMQLYGQGQYQQALAPAGEIVTRSETTFGPDSVETAASLNNLAELFSRLGRFDDAEPLYRRSLAIREKALPADHPDIAKSRARLAQLIENRSAAERMKAEQNRPHPAASATPRPDAAAQALLDHNRLVGEANRLTAEAAQFAGKEQWAPALADNLKVLALLEKLLPAGDVNIALVTANIGRLQTRTGQYAAAEASLRRALDLLVKIRGANDPEVKRVIDSLGELYRGQRINPASLPFAEDRVAGPGGPARPPVAASGAEIGPADLDQIGQLSRQTGDLLTASRFPEALPVALQLQALLERLYGPDNVAVALNLDSLARIYRGLGRQSDADLAAQHGQLIRDIIRAGSRGDSVKVP